MAQCKRGHVNDVGARYCGECGILMITPAIAQRRGKCRVCGNFWEAKEKYCGYCQAGAEGYEPPSPRPPLFMRGVRCKKTTRYGGIRCDCDLCRGLFRIGAVIKRDGEEELTVIGLLGQGGMGVVYLVEDSLGTQLVLKEAKHYLGGADQVLLERWQAREVIALAALDGSRLFPGCKGHFSFDGSKMLLMDLMPGECLEKVIARRTAFPVEEVTRDARGIAEVVREAH